MESWFPLGWQHYLAGGLLIGAGVSLLFIATGLIGGASTFFTSTLSYLSHAAHFQRAAILASRQWRLLYALGMLLGAAAFAAFAASVIAAGQPAFQTAIPGWQLALGGFIAGFGARLSNGCTSGHGICGMASLQLPSILAVLIFLATAMISARLVLLAGGL